MAAVASQRADHFCRGEKGQALSHSLRLRAETLSRHHCPSPSLRGPDRQLPLWHQLPEDAILLGWWLHGEKIVQVAAGAGTSRPGAGLRGPPSCACGPWGPTSLLPLDEPPDSTLSTHLLQAQPRPDGEVMPTLDMALFDWTDYEDLKPEVWPSAKKKGTSTYPTIPVLGRPSTPTICWSAQPDLQMSKVGG